MINIYKLADNGSDVKPELMDTWDNDKFGKSKAKMSRTEVLETYNRGYYFTSEADSEEKQ